MSAFLTHDNIAHVSRLTARSVFSGCKNCKSLQERFLASFFFGRIKFTLSVVRIVNTSSCTGSSYCGL